MPSDERRAWRYSAASTSLPGGLRVSSRSSPCTIRTISSPTSCQLMSCIPKMLPFLVCTIVTFAIVQHRLLFPLHATILIGWKEEVRYRNRFPLFARDTHFSSKETHRKRFLHE